MDGNTGTERYDKHAGTEPHERAALHGLKVVEIAQLLAGPFAGTLLADLGAEVIHIEDPGVGDPHRKMGAAKDGVKLWWKISGRNKKSVGLDLRTEEGREVARKLVAWADVVVTNMRPGTLTKWGLDWAGLHAVNPKLIMLQVSGYGATTARADEPGFGKVGEARSGVVHITGFPDGPPIHTGFSHADTMTGLVGAFGIQVALYRKHTDPEFQGEWIDLAVDEPLFRLLEWQVMLFDQLGVVPNRVGNGIFAATSAIVDVYGTSDGKWLTVTSGTPRSIQNMAKLVGLPVDDYLDHELIAENRPKLEAAIKAWIAQHSADEGLKTLIDAGVVAAPIFDIADIMSDQTYRERGNIVTVADPELGPLRQQGVMPRLKNHPGDVWLSAPRVGEHDGEVLRGYAGLSDADLAALKAKGVIAG